MLNVRRRRNRDMATPTKEYPEDNNNSNYTRSSSERHDVWQPTSSAPMRYLGFRNMGNSCYLNAVVQSLLGLPLFIVDLLQFYRRHQSAIDSGSMTESFAQLILEREKTIWGKPSYKIDNIMMAILGAASKSDVDYTTHRQMDAHELLIHIMDRLKVEAIEVERQMETGQGTGQTSAQRSDQSEDHQQSIDTGKVADQLKSTDSASSGEHSYAGVKQLGAAEEKADNPDGSGSPVFDEVAAASALLSCKNMKESYNTFTANSSTSKDSNTEDTAEPITTENPQFPSSVNTAELDKNVSADSISGKTAVDKQESAPEDAKSIFTKSNSGERNTEADTIPPEGSSVDHPRFKYAKSDNEPDSSKKEENIVNSKIPRDVGDTEENAAEEASSITEGLNTSIPGDEGTRSETSMVPSRQSPLDLITANFEAEIVYTRKCVRCGTCEERTECVTNIMVSIPLEYETPTLQSLLDSHFKSEEVDFSCEKCEQNVKAERTPKLRKLPRVLFLCVKRYSMKDKKQKKEDKDIIVSKCISVENHYTGNRPALFSMGNSSPVTPENTPESLSVLRDQRASAGVCGREKVKTPPSSGRKGTPRKLSKEFNAEPDAPGKAPSRKDDDDEELTGVNATINELNTSEVSIDEQDSTQAADSDVDEDQSDNKSSPEYKVIRMSEDEQLEAALERSLKESHCLTLFDVLETLSQVESTEEETDPGLEEKTDPAEKATYTAEEETDPGEETDQSEEEETDQSEEEETDQSEEEETDPAEEEKTDPAEKETDVAEEEETDPDQKETDPDQKETDAAKEEETDPAEEEETDPAEKETDAAEEETDPAEKETGAGEEETGAGEEEKTDPGEEEKTDPAEKETDPAEKETEPAEEETDPAEEEETDPAEKEETDLPKLPQDPPEGTEESSASDQGSGPSTMEVTEMDSGDLPKNQSPPAQTSPLHGSPLFLRSEGDLPSWVPMSVNAAGPENDWYRRSRGMTEDEELEEAMRLSLETMADEQLQEALRLSRIESGICSEAAAAPPSVSDTDGDTVARERADHHQAHPLQEPLHQIQTRIFDFVAPVSPLSLDSERELELQTGVLSNVQPDYAVVPVLTQPPYADSYEAKLKREASSPDRYVNMSPYKRQRGAMDYGRKHSTIYETGETVSSAYNDGKDSLPPTRHEVWESYEMPLPYYKPANVPDESCRDEKQPDSVPETREKEESWKTDLQKVPEDLSLHREGDSSASLPWTVWCAPNSFVLTIAPQESTEKQEEEEADYSLLEKPRVWDMDCTNPGYRLVGIVRHKGVKTEGDTLDLESGRWYTYNDQEVSEIEEYMAIDGCRKSGYYFVYLNWDIYKAIVQREPNDEEQINQPPSTNEPSWKQPSAENSLPRGEHPSAVYGSPGGEEDSVRWGSTSFERAKMGVRGFFGH